ncbi:hypothetical protein FRC01_007673 [Tulasnella sp. 417]|nr:hypothetical protein FRC01_007673 [Tulasnella sp. 417]
MYRASFHAVQVALFQGIRVEDRPEYNLPNLTSLYLTMFAPRELTSLLTIVHPQKLAYLELCDTFLDHNHTLTEELISLRLPSLKDILIRGRFMEDNPIVTWLCQIAPNLGTLELSIKRNYITLLTTLLESDQILQNFQQIRLWIKIGYYEKLDTDSPDLAALIGVVKARGWKYWVWVGIVSTGAWIYEG